MTIQELVERYFAALERGATGEDLAAHYHAEVVQEEFPNRFSPHGARRNLSEILAAAERGQRAIAGHRYQILSILVDGHRAAVEFAWSGTLAVPVGTLTAGTVMRGRFASFLEFQDGRILAQRSYDCFDSW
jgi:ketosteroid isomerase-like protein